MHTVDLRGAVKEDEEDEEDDRRRVNDRKLYINNQIYTRALE